MDSINEYFQYVSLSIYGCFMDCVGFMGLFLRRLAWWVWLVGLFEMRWLYSHALVGGKAGLPLNWGTMPPIPWVMSSPQAHNHMHILSMKPPSPPHTHTHLHTNPKEENENSLVLTITTTNHTWKNVEKLSGCVYAIFQVSCVNILSENVGALFLYFTNNWQV